MISGLIMAKFTFADRYVEAGLLPSAEIITLRDAPVKRIVENISNEQILDLVAVYYGSTEIDLEWFRDEFFQEDISFSLVNNERETRILAALILGMLIEDENEIAILAVSVGSVKGCRLPSQSSWLLVNAEEALRQLSVDNRASVEIATKVQPTSLPKLGEEIDGLATNDWATLIAILAKIRSEAQSSAKTTASQITKALNSFDRQVQLMREESQMLWWLIGGHSRTFERSFTTFGPQQAALVGAIDLAALTTYSQFGPIAMPAMLEKVIASAKKTKGQQSCELTSAIDGFAVDDLKCLDVPTKLPAKLAPISTAIELARVSGSSAWHSQFKVKTGLDTSIKLDHVSLAEQLYRESLLGQLLW